MVIKIIKTKVQKYLVNRVEDSRNDEVAELIDTFTRPDGRVMYTLLFNDGELRGYYFDEFEPLIKLVK